MFDKQKNTILAHFAVIEGCDGSGTTTQLKLLEKRFKEGGSLLPPFLATVEPTGGPVGLLIRRALCGDESMIKPTLARLFAADRGEHLYGPNGIVERCKSGTLVVSDRYTPSSLVYQGLECGRALPLYLNAQFPHPELLFYLDIDPQIAMKRIDTRREKKEIYEKLEFQTRVREAYLELLPWYADAGVRVVSLDGTQEAQELADIIWSEIKKMPIMDV